MGCFVLSSCCNWCDACLRTVHRETSDARQYPTIIPNESREVRILKYFESSGGLAEVMRRRRPMFPVAAFPPKDSGDAVVHHAQAVASLSPLCAVVMSAVKLCRLTSCGVQDPPPLAPYRCVRLPASRLLFLIRFPASVGWHVPLLLLSRMLNQDVIPRELGQLSVLKELRLNNCKLTGENHRSFWSC